MAAPRRLEPRLPNNQLPPAPPSPPKQTRLPTKRISVKLACDNCRARKAKCNGAQPCLRCLNSRAKCVYSRTESKDAQIESLKRKLSDNIEDSTGLNRLYELMRDRPADEAMAIFNSIRRGNAPDDIVRRVEHGDVLLQLNLMPEVRYRYEFPFRKEMPAYLLRSQSRYLRSFLFKPPFPVSGSASDATPDARSASSLGSRTLPSSSMLPPSDCYTKPYSAVTLVEPLLTDADISRWTSVPSTPAFLQRLMQTYLLHTWPVFTHFHKGLFLLDLRAGRRRFCSSLLVNVILAAACHVAPELSRRNEYWDPTNYGYLFLAETRRLLELEGGRDRLTTIQALLVLNQTINEQGMDEVSHGYLMQAIDMAKRMGLLGPVASPHGADWRVAREFTAWAVFSWQAIVSYAKKIPPILNDEPQTPFPDPGHDSAWYDEVWVRYPLSNVVVPMLFPATYHAQLKFRVILRDLASTIASQGPDGKLSLHHRARFYSRLASWYDELPASLQAEYAALPSQLGVHFQYWAVITSLFEDLDPADKVKLTLQGQSIQDIAQGARCNFEIVLRIYYLRHGFDMYNTWAFFFLTNLCFLAIGELHASIEAGGDEADATRSTLILASKGMSTQARCYYLAEAMLRTVCMHMDAGDVLLLGKYTSFQDLHDAEATVQRLNIVKSGWQQNMVLGGKACVRETDAVEGGEDKSGEESE